MSRTLKCLISFTIRDMQIKMTPRFYLIPVIMARIKSQVTTLAREDVEQGEHSFIAGGNGKNPNFIGILH